MTQRGSKGSMEKKITSLFLALRQLRLKAKIKGKLQRLLIF